MLYRFRYGPLRDERLTTFIRIPSFYRVPDYPEYGIVCKVTPIIGNLPVGTSVKLIDDTGWSEWD